MPVLFGDTRPDGLIRVWRTLHRVRGQEVNPADYPEGYAFDALPTPPEMKPGIDHIMLFSPATGQFVWEEQERPPTDSELMQQLKPRMDALEQAAGVGGPGKAGIAQRLDAMQAEIDDLKARVAMLG